MHELHKEWIECVNGIFYFLAGRKVHKNIHLDMYTTLYILSNFFSMLIRCKPFLVHSSIYDKITWSVSVLLNQMHISKTDSLFVFEAEEFENKHLGWYECWVAVQTRKVIKYSDIIIRHRYLHERDIFLNSNRSKQLYNTTLQWPYFLLLVTGMITHSGRTVRQQRYRHSGSYNDLFFIYILTL